MRIWRANIVTEDELDSTVSKLLNDLHTVFRQRKAAPGAHDYDRKERAILTELNLLAELFPASRKTRIRAKINADRWCRSESRSTPGVQVVYE